MKRLLRAALLTSSLAMPAFAGEGAPPPTTQVVEQSQKAARPTLDVVFVLDTTGSMGSLLEGAKQKIWSIASRMASGTPTPRIRVGLVAFRDRGDAYVTKRFDLTEDLDAAYGTLRGFQAGGGGDGPEHVGQALGEAVKFMSWSQDTRAAKMIFVVGDAPAHDDYNDGWNTSAWAKKAIASGIVVNTVRCGGDGDTEKQFREVAKLADGTFVSIEQSGGMVAVATPFDAEMAKLNGAIADKSLVGGSTAARSAGKAELDELKAMPSSVVSDRAGFMAKTAPAAPMAAPKSVGTVYLNAAPALVNTMKDEELPEAVRVVEKSKREDFVKQQVAAQNELQGKLVELSKKRDAYLKDNVAKKADSFDDQVFEGVKKSAAKAGVAY
jgi:Mg-chelatase subunit ChlD